MSTIFSNGTFSEENWILVEDDADLARVGDLLLPLDRFLATPRRYLEGTRRIAILVSAGDKVELLEDYLDLVALVAIEFPKFTDGRGFSAARVLREQMSYKGDIRAVGDYILDQVPLMRRCGVSSFEITKAEVIKALEDGEWPEVTKYLQPVGTVDEIPVGTRPWARLSRREFSEAAE